MRKYMAQRNLVMFYIQAFRSDIQETIYRGIVLKDYIKEMQL